MLVELKELLVFDNQLKALPASIGKLSELELLDVSENHITELPEEFGGLVTLKDCNLGDNKLTALPRSIGKCDRLEVLKVSNNELAALPIEMQELVDLKELYVDFNKITELPSELDEMIEELEVFANEENPFTDPHQLPLLDDEEFEDQVLVFLSGGGVFKKYSRKNKPTPRLVYLSISAMKVECRDSKRMKGAKDAIPVGELAEVMEGTYSTLAGHNFPSQQR